MTDKLLKPRRKYCNIILINAIGYYFNKRHLHFSFEKSTKIWCFKGNYSIGTDILQDRHLNYGYYTIMVEKGVVIRDNNRNAYFLLLVPSIPQSNVTVAGYNPHNSTTTEHVDIRIAFELVFETFKRLCSWKER